MSILIRVQGLSKTYSTGSIQVAALIDVSVDIAEGEFVAVMGPSGSGKSTLMNLLGCLDVPSSGSYQLDGKELVGLNEDRLAKVRNQEIGFVFQSYNLIPKLTAQQNVEAPLIYRRVPRSKRRRSQPRPWSRSASRTGATTSRANSRAASSSAPPSPGLS